MYKVKVEKFEGPLDLLLELIEDEKLDITEISLSNITDRYLSEIAGLDPKTYDVSEFLLVAARLLYLKSKALLPSLETEEEEAEVEDLKQKLEVYRKYRDAAREFGNILDKNQRSYPAKKPHLSVPTFTPPKGVQLPDLMKTFQRLISDMPEELAREEIELPSEKITVEQKLLDLSQVLSTKKEHKFSDVIKTAKTRIEAIITFLAILELVKCKKIRVTQSKNFDDIDLVMVK